VQSHEKRLNTNQTIHQVLIHPRSFIEQPKGWQMGKITNDLKKSHSKPVVFKEILELFGKGHCIMLSNAETDENNSFRFISSSIFAIDIDDDQQVISPEEVMFSLKNKVAGLFYTFSHGLKGNRYRLVFQLDQSINDELKMKGIIEMVANDLKNLGLPVDAQAKNPLQIVRGGKHSVLVNEQNRLDTNKLLERLKQETLKRQQDLYNSFEKELRPVSFKVLKEMAEKVGHIPSGEGKGELWKRLVVGIKHYASMGHITDEEGFELFDIISGGEQSQKAWEQLRSNGQATIKSLIYEAKNKGYEGKFTYYENEEQQKVSYSREIIKVNRYLPIDTAKEIISRKQRILVNSPTGSGKTTSFLESFKDLENADSHFYIFSAPTIALTLQNATKHGIMSVKGQTKNLFKAINQKVKNGKRVFISTYDMTPILIEFLKMIEPRTTFTLVVDEMHKFVTDYDLNYRYEAIKNLHEISKQAQSFIGLSGTVDDIYKDEFETVIQIDNGNPQSPCQEFAVYTYEKKADSLPELVQLIEVWSSKRKLLIFLQSKKKIEQLKKVLQRKGLKVRAINASNKSNLTYKQLVDSETIDPDIQVVLTTSVIADGINIKNDLDWEVIAVCNEYSNLFNYSSIKQISNRLRNEYRRFSLFIQEPKNIEQQPFQLENAYNFRLKLADQLVNEINNHPYFDARLFRSSVIEKRYGVYQGTEKLEIDTLFLRHAVSNEQERYFHSYRLAFVDAVEKVLHKKANGLLNISKEIRENRLDLTFTREILQELNDIEEQEKDGKNKSISTMFTPDIYKSFVQKDEEVLNKFKEEVLPIHFSCLFQLTKVADYQTCHKVVCQVKRDADTHSFFNSIRYLTDALYLHSINRPSKTRNVLERLLKLNEFLLNQDFEDMLLEIAKKTRTTKKDVKEVEKMLEVEKKRDMYGRYRRVTGIITVESIAEQFGVPVDAVKKAALKYAKTKGKTYESVIRTKLYL
jgi:hypothetical protein